MNQAGQAAAVGQDSPQGEILSEGVVGPSAGSFGRFSVLAGHHDIFGRLFGAAVRTAIHGDGLTVIRFVSPAARRLDLQLFSHDRFDLEGDLTLAVRDVETGLMLAGLTFCLVENEGERVAIIGGLHAADDPRTRGLIRDVAKDLFGLRPKAFSLWCLQQLTLPWDIRQIQVVGDEQQVRGRWRRREGSVARRDEFWRESDGRRLPEGGRWQIPLLPPRRHRDELKPSRRRAHELRYAMLAAFQPALVAAFASLAPGEEEGGGAGAVRGPVEHVCSPGRAASGPGSAPFVNDFNATNHSF